MGTVGDPVNCHAGRRAVGSRPMGRRRCAAPRRRAPGIPRPWRARQARAVTIGIPSPMDSPPETTSPFPPLPWDELRALAGRHARARLGIVRPEDLEDIVQMAMVRLLRASRGAPVENPRGLTSTVTDRAAKDWLRARRRWRARFCESADPGERAPDPNAPEPGAFGDPLERVRFTVLEYFRQADGPCAEIATAYFESRDWGSVAAAAGLAAAAVRKRWSRCVDRLRLELRGTLAPLFEALNGDGA